MQSQLRECRVQSAVGLRISIRFASLCEQDVPLANSMSHETERARWAKTTASTASWLELRNYSNQTLVAERIYGPFMLDIPLERARSTRL